MPGPARRLPSSGSPSSTPHACGAARLALGKDGHWAEDLAQETLVEAWRSLARFDGRCRFSTWLYGILRHRFLKGRRHQNAARISAPDALGQVPSTAYTPDRSAEASEDARRVRRAVASLPEEHRLVVELRFFAGATLDEIAAALGCPLGTVKSRLHHALEKLRQMNLAVNLFTLVQGSKGEQTMNDLHHPCELWAEPISLAAAGCLSADEEREVRRHIETCSDCRERFRQLTQLCGALAEARLPAKVAEAAIVERVMSAVASDESRRPTGSQAGGDDSARATYPFPRHMEVDHAFPSFPRCGGGHFRSGHHRSCLVVPRRRRDPAFADFLPRSSKRRPSSAR